MSETADEAIEPEPRWHALIAILAAAGLYVALPDQLTHQPHFLMPGAVGLLLVPLVLSHQSGWHRVNHALGISVTTLLTAFMIGSLCLLVTNLPSMDSSPVLLESAGALWLSNILIFALWYWRLDAGGPYKRDLRSRHTQGAFLFPQMTLPSDGRPRWSPQFVDYLFLAFNTSTAFSPTDTPVLTRWGKLLMMIQSTISLAILVLLAARAVNIITPRT